MSLLRESFNSHDDEFINCRRLPWCVSQHGQNLQAIAFRWKRGFLYQALWSTNRFCDLQSVVPAVLCSYPRQKVLVRILSTILILSFYYLFYVFGSTLKFTHVNKCSSFWCSAAIANSQNSLQTWVLVNRQNEFQNRRQQDSRTNSRSRFCYEGKHW